MFNELEELIRTFKRRVYPRALRKIRQSQFATCLENIGTRISDTLQLTWAMLLDDDKFELIEKKTKKRRETKINNGFQKHIKDCFKALTVTDKSEYCFISLKKRVFSTQRINEK